MQSPMQMNSSIFFSTHGIPAEVLTDQGTNFMSKLLAELYRLLNIKHLRTTPHTPQQTVSLSGSMGRLWLCCEWLPLYMDLTGTRYYHTYCLLTGKSHEQPQGSPFRGAIWAEHTRASRRPERVMGRHTEPKAEQLSITL